MRSRTNARVAAVALAGLSLATLVTGAAKYGNGKPPSGSSTGTGQVFFPNPVASLQNQTSPTRTTPTTRHSHRRTEPSR